MSFFCNLCFSWSWTLNNGSFSVYKNVAGLKYTCTVVTSSTAGLLTRLYFTQAWGERLGLPLCNRTLKTLVFFPFMYTVKYALTRLMKERPLQTVTPAIGFMLSLSSCFVVAVGQTVNSRAIDILTHHQNLWRTPDFLHCQSYLP